ncbi:HAD family hydrolase [Phycicoccus sp. CSK15P-2]|uniref:HAD family hydrolase n=1 Tax=Phycicoccus sp. CSK15P-2 TaxID=2807627 RepID=UPI00194E574A|nr:HAD family hydrolase [Phycicoccus sp. CSK15P-2]MBM6405612.1 HAD family hydrolase [Phycicoccus sp. CSK15P-2]
MLAGPRVEAVLLDADDTLYDTRSAMHAAGAAAARALWPDADPERLAAAGVRFRSDPEGHFVAYSRGEIEFDEMRRARVAELAGWLGQSTERDWWDGFEQTYEPAFLAGLRAFDDVAPAVERLLAAGVVVGVLTNSSSTYTDRKMHAAGLAGLFDVVCTRDTLGFGKPDERAFHEACRRMGALPATTMHVGDELAADPLGAAEAGLAAAWLVRDGQPDERALRLVEARKVPVVRSLASVPELVDGDAARFGPGAAAR